MQFSPTPIVKDIVLIGGGHSHAVALRQWAMQPEPGVRLTLIGTDTHTPYSGMLPGYVAGHYSYDEVHLDLRRLATAAGARYFHDEVVGLDLAQRLVLCRHRPPVPYDVASINIGSTPQVGRVPGAAEHSIAVKPIRRFNERWLALLERVRNTVAPLRVAVVGAGAGGVELTLAMQHRCQQERAAQGLRADSVRFELFCADADILPSHNPRVRALCRDWLQTRGVVLHTHAKITGVQEDGYVQAGAQRHGPFDDVVWVTQAGGPAWLAHTGLALDEQGFVRVNSHLQTLTDPLVFAAGDVASMEGHCLEKAGVFAVRQGLPLLNNLRLAVQGQALQPYRPQKAWLALLGTGGLHAVASRGWWSAQGAWVWRWKERIDRRFMRMFSDLSPMGSAHPGANPAVKVALSAEDSTQLLAAQAMRCGGCGAKVGASVLSRALGRLYTVPNPDVLLGLDAPDDAAVVRVPPGQLLVHTVDFFRAFVDDPYVFGRIAATHALGDIYAMGARPHTATAIATVPPGLEAKVEDTVHQLMAGAVDVLNAASCSLVGGHTGEGQELALGFAINGLLDDVSADSRRPQAWTKGGLQVGQCLVLSKPIGTGVLMAAHARGLARGRWVDAALHSMQISPQAAVAVLQAHGATACTDITGFGLLGHTVEMAQASGCRVALLAAAIPLLDGALELAQAGVSSSLQPANVRLKRALRLQQQAATLPVYPLLFDPQTAGGLLASVPADQAQACVQALHAQGYPHAAVVGHVLAREAVDDPLELRP